MRIAVIAFAAVALATPVLAQSGAGAPAPAPAATPKKKIDDPNRIVCKREHVVGSNRPQKVCMTVADRERLKDQTDQLTDPGRRSAGTAEDFKNGPAL
ncbi:hypothetical protein GVN21_10415 [Caulobacter sp. SLTY]|uniref:hypothetical protein n=1 Tax=Caulobacter sp. SLTY TaxID=2683262 RepID=UPI001412987F|nr:hypothetical protein [Caulobacter sp. SLTY]NBB15767.1 hypothetical protein [Caulobacter sp. SLTY]